uniref:Uncharacterized protein n=1 Tax=Arundo donax TaxID=35708 RepID=A0A0A9FLN8_ARUDO
MHLVLRSSETSMRKIKDNPIEPSVLQVSMKFHSFHVNTMQNRGLQSFQVHYI